MREGGINERILMWIRKNSEEDEAVYRFLIEIVYEEAEHPERWRWKDAYVKRMQQYSEERGESHED